MFGGWPWFDCSWLVGKTGFEFCGLPRRRERFRRVGKYQLPDWAAHSRDAALPPKQWGAFSPLLGMLCLGLYVLSRLKSFRGFLKSSNMLSSCNKGKLLASLACQTIFFTALCKFQVGAEALQRNLHDLLCFLENAQSSAFQGLVQVQPNWRMDQVRCQDCHCLGGGRLAKPTRHDGRQRWWSSSRSGVGGQADVHA